MLLVAVQANLPNQFLLAFGGQVPNFLKVDSSTLTAASSQYVCAGFESLINLKRRRRAGRKGMNAGRRGRFAGTMLGHDQHGNIILRQLADDRFHGPHAGTDALHPETATTALRRSGACQDFGSIQTHRVSLHYVAAKI